MIKIKDEGRYIAPQVDVIESLYDEVLCVSSMDTESLEELNNGTWEW